jgi:SGNH hydrolase-like domain, acetyltransferase AlgX
MKTIRTVSAAFLLSLHSTATAQASYCPNYLNKAPTLLKTQFGEIYPSQTGWFFEKKMDLTPNPLPDDLTPLRGLMEQLNKSGVKTFVALLPPRPLAQQKMTRGVAYNLTQALKFHTDALKRFAALPGVRVIDLMNVLSDRRSSTTNLWMSRDNHWQSAGAVVAAQYIASHIQQDKALSKLPRNRIDLTELQPRHYTQAWDIYVSTVCGGHPAVIDQLMYGSVSRNQGLLDNTDSVFALVGSSYSGFSLKALLEHDMGWIGEDHSVPGGGTLTGFEQLLQEAAVNKRLPKFIVWEYPEVYLNILTDTMVFNQLSTFVSIARNNLKVYNFSSFTLNNKSNKIHIPSAEIGKTRIIKIQLSDLSIHAFKVTASYGPNDLGDYIFSRSEAIKNTGLFAFTAPRDVTGLDLELPAGTGTVTVSFMGN